MAFELEAHFGDEAARDYRTAMRVLHGFAQKTGCPLGVDVIKWFGEKVVELDMAMRSDRQALTKDKTNAG